MRFFPDNEEEISLIKFIAEYQYINVRDEKYFFKSSRYYRNKIKNLLYIFLMSILNLFVIMVFMQKSINILQEFLKCYLKLKLKLDNNLENGDFLLSCPLVMTLLNVLVVIL